VGLLQYVLFAGMYPRVGVPNEHNADRSASEARFNTRHCAGACLHPTSVLNGDDATPAPTEAVAFMELLETTKLFLCNLVRAPALQALLLVAHRVDTDAAGSQLVVDRWLLFQTASPQVGVCMGFTRRTQCVVVQCLCLSAGLGSSAGNRA